MLDAYIIDRIRREREQRDSEDARIPLHIEVPPELPPDIRPEMPRDSERGSVEIDLAFSI